MPSFFWGDRFELAWPGLYDLFQDLQYEVNAITKPLVDGMRSLLTGYVSRLQAADRMLGFHH